MWGEDISRALGDISEEKIAAAAGVGRPRRRRWWVRILTAAATLALLVTCIALLPEQEKQNTHFAVYVYINETEKLELTPEGKTGAFSNISGAYLASAFELPAEWETGFRVDIILTDEAADYQNITILRDGLPIAAESKDILIVRCEQSGADGANGLCVLGSLAGEAELEIQFKNEAGEILQSEQIRVSFPVDGSCYVELLTGKE